MSASKPGNDPAEAPDENPQPYPEHDYSPAIPEFIIEQSIEDPEKTKEVEDGKIGKKKDQ
jgi:hypothetical protein